MLATPCQKHSAKRGRRDYIPACTTAEVGERVKLPIIVTVVLADVILSSSETALTVTELGLGSAAGAVPT